jgi:hypothetical protein
MYMGCIKSAIATDKISVTTEAVQSVSEGSTWNQLVSEKCALIYPEIAKEIAAALKRWNEINKEVIDAAWQLEKISGVREPALRSRIKKILQTSDNFKTKNACVTTMYILKRQNIKVDTPQKYNLIMEASEAKPTVWPPRAPLTEYIAGNTKNVIVASNVLGAPSPSNDAFHEHHQLFIIDEFEIIISKNTSLDIIVKNIELSKTIIANSTPLASENSVGFEAIELALETVLLSYADTCKLSLSYSKDLIQGIKFSGKIKTDNKKSFCESLAYVLAFNNLLISKTNIGLQVKGF